MPRKLRSGVIEALREIEQRKSFFENDKTRHRVSASHDFKPFIPAALRTHFRELENLFKASPPRLIETTQKTLFSERAESSERGVSHVEISTTSAHISLGKESQLSSLYFEATHLKQGRAVYKLTRQYLVKFDAKERIASFVMLEKNYDSIRVNRYSFERDGEGLIRCIDIDSATSVLLPSHEKWHTAFSRAQARAKYNSQSHKRAAKVPEPHR